MTGCRAHRSVILLAAPQVRHHRGAANTYVGSASVTGTVLNQYAMSEHEGHLRIATTTAPAWQPWRTESGPESESFVTVPAKKQPMRAGRSARRCRCSTPPTPRWSPGAAACLTSASSRPSRAAPRGSRSWCPASSATLRCTRLGRKGTSMAGAMLSAGGLQ
ncbi:beta-propeller domain-containing protein [Candidatus Poriferisodalis sp.]|uniref:beta-propeller domain-containing protein n=1 Tax=Candidatus Poriferisodalis sp. TaxID=3101277 RepID=UPI003B019166